MSCGKKHILVIDDEPDVRTYLATLLQDNGYSVTTADDGEQGWQQVQKATPDLITLDITMPEKSGVRFFKDMRESEEYKDVPIIMVTGVSGEFENFISSRRKVRAPDGYIRKPVDHKELLTKVGDLLG